MIVDLDLQARTCKVTRQSTDPRFSSGGWSEAESTFLYRVKAELATQGFDVIKKRMYKDGHLVDDTQQYIRTRSTGPDSFAIYNPNYAIFDAGLEFNRTGQINLAVVKEL